MAFVCGVNCRLHKLPLRPVYIRKKSVAFKVVVHDSEVYQVGKVSRLFEYLGASQDKNQGFIGQQLQRFGYAVRLRAIAAQSEVFAIGNDHIFIIRQ